jgi:hypothetical protein
MQKYGAFDDIGIAVSVRRRTVPSGLASHAMDHQLLIPMAAAEHCGEVRRRADMACARAGELKQSAAVARSALLDSRRDLTRAQHVLDEARAGADPSRISKAKLEARAAYQRVIRSHPSASERQRAATEWLHEIDRLNRETRRANRALLRAETAARHLDRICFEAERQADAARIAAESASAACAEGRQRLADCEGAPDDLPMPALATPFVETAESAATIRAGDLGPAAMVIERIAFGDRDALRAVATELSNLTGQPVSHYLLLLREFADAVREVASERLFLAFEDAHPLWSQFDKDERQAIVRALFDLGFRYDVDEGWYGGRAPGTADMAMALAYAGHDPRTIRRQLTAEELRNLPQSMVVSPVECLAALAPNLTLAQMFELLGPRADSLGALWDDWGRLRQLLLSEAATLVQA